MTMRPIRISKRNWSFEVDEKGEMRVDLDDFGWTWDGDGADLILFLSRICGSKTEGDFISTMEESGISVKDMRPYLLESVKDSESLYGLSGDNQMWRFGIGDELIDLDYELGEELEERGLTDEQVAKIRDVFYNEVEAPDYDEFDKYYGKEYRKKLVDVIDYATEGDDFGDICVGFAEIKEDATEDVYDMIRESEWEAFSRAMGKVLQR